MIFIKSVFKNIFSKELPKPMGRWNIDYCNKKINNKIDLSNEDHCGPCGQYALNKIESKNKKYKIQLIKSDKTIYNPKTI